MRSWSKQHKVLATTFVLALITTLVGVASYAVWTSTSTSTGNLFATTNISITSDKAATSIVTLSGMVPGDTKVGLTDVTAGADLMSYKVTVTASTDNALVTSATNGLNLEIDRCGVAWGGSAPNYTCASPTNLYNAAITNGVFAAYDVSLISVGDTFCVGATPTGGRPITCDSTIGGGSGPVDHLRFRVTLPSGADNSVMNLTNTFSFAFYGQSPTGVNL